MNPRSLRSAVYTLLLCMMALPVSWAQVEQTTRTLVPRGTSSIPAHTGSTPVPEKDFLVQPDHPGINPANVKPANQSRANANALSADSATQIFTTPTPRPKTVLGPTGGFVGFNGLSHFDQRFAGTGIYTNTQFSLEPPDQGLCTGNGFVLESVNNALAVYDKSGTLLQGPIATANFLDSRPR
jgi:hypothetical protein